MRFVCRAATRGKAVGEEPPEDLPHQFVVAPPAVFFNYDHYDNYNDDYHSNTGSGSE